MENPVDPAARQRPSDAANWANQGVNLRVSEVPTGAINLNVEGRAVVGPLQGFGPLWQKTYRVRIPADRVSPQELTGYWKEHFGDLQPKENRFYAPRAGVTPGGIVLMNASAQGLPVNSGLMILYSDDESFTFMTPEGCPEAGWIMCSVFEEDGSTVAQVRTQGRANDPIFEVGFRMFGARQQEAIWTYVLNSLAERFDAPATATIERVCLDPRMQWSRASNVRHNATIRSFIYAVLSPARAIGRVAGGSRRG